MYIYSQRRLSKGIVASLIILSMLLNSIPAFSQNTECYNWYCTRTKDHTRPKLDATLSWIEQKEYGALFIDPYCTDEAEQEDRVLYLTFDAGYENGNVSKVLDVLKEKSVPGAFFVLSHVIETEDALVERILNEGHLLCNHTAHHKNMATICDRETFVQELTTLEELCLQKTGQTLAKFYRPPEGKFTREQLLWAGELGYYTVFWSFAYADWDNSKQPSKEQAIEKITSNLHNGAILLLHPTSATNAAILGEVIDYCHAQGFRFESLTHLLRIPDTPKGAE